MFGQNGGMLASERPKTWNSKLVTVSAVITVPADVQAFLVDGCAPGGGGGGGDPTPGGGGGGGGGGIGVKGYWFPVVPGEVLTITIGAVGTGGAAGANGVGGGTTSIVGSLSSIVLIGGGAGGKGANPNGGNGGSLLTARVWGTLVAGGTGGAGVGPAGVVANASNVGAAAGASFGSLVKFCSGAAGGALTYAGGNTVPTGFGEYYGVSGAGNASGGGGGAGGGCGNYGVGGNGGSNGAAGATATGYGAGGGGGSGNTAGGDASPGFFRLLYLSAYKI